jgi:predicted small metal-binding protein
MEFSKYIFLALAKSTRLVNLIFSCISHLLSFSTIIENCAQMINDTAPHQEVLLPVVDHNDTAHNNILEDNLPTDRKVGLSFTNTIYIAPVIFD